MDTGNFDGDVLESFQQFLISYRNKKGTTYSRKHINTLTKFIKHVFKWASQKRLIHRTLADEIVNVPLLSYDPENIREGEHRHEVPKEHVEAVFPFVLPVVADIPRIQLLTGMRPDEVCRMTATGNQAVA